METKTITSKFNTQLDRESVHNIIVCQHPITIAHVETIIKECITDNYKIIRTDLGIRVKFESFVWPKRGFIYPVRK